MVEDHVHGWMTLLARRAFGWLPRIDPFIGLGTPTSVRVLARVLTSPRRVGRGSPMAVDRGFRSYMTLPAAGETIIVTIGSTRVEVTCDRAGYVDTVIDLVEGSSLEPGWQRVVLQTTGRGPMMRVGHVLIIGPDSQYGVISDIDDTIMETSVPRLAVALWNTFLARPSSRRAVPGMPQLYRWLATRQPTAPFIYLSAGAWNSFRNLERFFTSFGYPRGPKLLTDFGPTATGWFRSGPQHKRVELQWLIETFPQVTWLLIGDDGQSDPQVYAEIASRYPQRIAGVATHLVKPQRDSGGRTAAGGPAGSGGEGTGASKAGSASVPVPMSVPTANARDGLSLRSQLDALDVWPTVT
jgi:phosphatidate phosphatase APP1